MESIFEDGRQVAVGSGGSAQTQHGSRGRRAKTRDLTQYERNVEKLLKHVADGDIEMVSHVT